MMDQRRTLAMLGMHLALSEMMSRSPESAKGMDIVLTPGPPDIDLLPTEYDRFSADGNVSLPMAPLSKKERARRKKRREMAYESRKRNRRKKS